MGDGVMAARWHLRRDGYHLVRGAMKLLEEK